jgi:DNA-binding HxlR family transcriptional regulator
VGTSGISDQNCSIARALAVVGERWTLLVVRELALGRRRFGEIRRNVGVSTNILTDRLQTLLHHGLATRTPVTAPGQVFDYALTERGRDLIPVLVALTRWGDRHAPGENGPPRVWWHLACDHPADPEFTCTHCGQTIGAGELRVAPGPGADNGQRREGLLPATA